MPSMGTLLPCLRNKRNAMSVEPVTGVHGEPDVAAVHRTVHFGKVRE